MPRVIAIDGPSAAGKSTVARQLANQLDFFYLDTGATYRIAAYIAKKKNIDVASPRAILQALLVHEIDYAYPEAYLDKKDVSKFLRSEEISTLASQLATSGQVRRYLVSLQRDIVAKHKKDAVVEGRDIATVVFPNAELKIFLTANAEIRAQRRAKELNLDSDNAQLLVEQRDQRDMTRKESPLTIAADAILIDTSELTIDETVKKIIQLWQQITKS